MPNVKVWLASLPERLYINKKKYRPSKIFRNPATERLLADAGHDIVEHDVVWGWAEIGVDQARYTQLSLLSDEERRQIRQWSLLLGAATPADLSQRLVSFGVAATERLPERKRVVYLDGGHNRGLAVSLSPSLQETLLEAFDPPLAEPPSLCLRIPAEWAALVMSKRLHSFWLPDEACSCSVRLRWDALGLQRQPDVVVRWDPSGGVELNQSVQQEIADALRVARQQLEDELEAHDTMATIERLICCAQQNADDLDVDLQKSMIFQGNSLDYRKGKQHRRFKT